MKRVLVGFLALIMLSSCTQMFIDLSKPLEDIFGKVNAPEFSLEEGSFDQTQDVVITTETKGATIYWSDDGSTPSKDTHTGSGKERVTIALNKTCSMKAIALKEGYMNSLVVEKKYKMAVLTPTITQNGRNSFTIATTTTGATLYYTLDGSAPTDTNNAGSGAGSVTFNLDPGTKTIKALGIKTGYENSDLKEWTGTILKELPQLVILGDNSTDLTNASSLSFGTVNPNASKDMTLTIKNNGWNSLNLTGSPKVTVIGAGFSLKTDASVSSIASLASQSVVISFTNATMGTYSGTLTIANDSENAPNYSITLTAVCYPTDPPVSGVTVKQGEAVLTTGSGVYDFGMVDIAGSGSTIIFRIDNNSGAALTLNANPVALNGDASFTIKTQPSSTIPNGSFAQFELKFTPTSAGAKNATALIVMNGKTDNPFVFFVKGVGAEKVADPVFSLSDSAEYATDQTTTITSATSEAIIRYTTDGSTPSKTTGTVYSGQITINKPTIIKAIAYKDGYYLDSGVISKVYYIPMAHTMVSVHGGSWSMQGAAVTLSDYYIGNTEVTWKLWKEVYDWAISNGYSLNAGHRGSAGTGSDYQPVTYVNWYDMVKWCNACSEKEGLTPVYYTNTTKITAYRSGETDITNEMINMGADGYRLPTEAEWEYAARGGIDGIADNYTYSGSNNADEVAWHSGNSSGKTWAVGLKKPNKLGLYDMTGNVWDFCWDKYGPFSGGVNPLGTLMGTNRVGKGGYWGFEGSLIEIVYRGNNDSYISGTVSGFRLAASSSFKQLQAAAPTFSVSGGVYGSTQSVTIGTTTTGATVYYTTDGSMPSATNNAGSGIGSVTVNISDNTCIKAIAIKTDMRNSMSIIQYYDLKSYAMRDTGPSGGLIFYVNPNSQIDGWKYLEAWTADEAGTYAWKTSNTSTPGTSTAIGTGYVNTFSMKGTEHPAAEVVRNANHGGKSDWFLPSKDELNQMYINLKQQGTGNFSDASYWSSSEYYSSYAYYYLFDSGNLGSFNKFENRLVRAIRAF